MRKIVVISVIFFTFLQTSQATECSGVTYKEEKINLYFCQNYSGFLETRALLYKAKTKVLNDYIKDKIAKGELKDKKFEIQIYDRVLTYPHLELTQGKNGYFVSLSGYPTLQELIIIVDYFSKTDWEPFISGDYQTINVEKRIDNFYKQNRINETISYQPFSIWEKDGISLQYLSDSLKYIIDDTSLTFQVNSNLPVKIRDRYLIFQQDSIFVVQDMQTIQSLKREDWYYEDFKVYVFPKWVNIGWYEKDNWTYSYSYDKNRFYVNKKYKN